MKKAFLTFMLLIFVVNSVFAQKGSEPKPIPGQFIVVLKEDVAKPVINQKRIVTNDREKKEQQNSNARSSNLTKVREIASKSNLKQDVIVYEYADILSGFTAKLNDNEVKSLRANPNVEGVYQDYEVQIVSNFTSYDECEEEASFYAQTTTCAVTKAGGPVDGSSKATWIWILDTGIDLDHPDLNVQTSATYAKSFIAGQTVEDGHGHGTHVAGIAAAKNNSIGVVGVSSGARVVPVKVLSNSGSGSFSGIISGLNHVAMYDIPGDVVNMSIEAYGYANCQNSNPALRDAIFNLGNAGTYVVMAAGNESANANLNLPGCINGNRVYTVGSITCANACSGFSNWGNSVDWVAVGSSVYSTHKNGGYTTMNGTSMASPVVAGVIHARNAPPLSAGNVNCSGANYPIARR